MMSLKKMIVLNSGLDYDLYIQPFFFGTNIQPYIATCIFSLVFDFDFICMCIVHFKHSQMYV